MKKSLTHKISTGSLLIIVILIISSNFSFAQDQTQYEIETRVTATSSGVVPFWMRSNKFGAIPLKGASGTFVGRITKNYETLSYIDSIYGHKKVLDWGYGFEGRANGGNNSNIQLIQAYAKARIWIFQLKAGRTKDVMGLNGDSTLSSGNFAVSGNSLGIPKVDLSIPDYWTVPIFDGLFAIKGNVVHGWVGHAKILDSIPLLTADKKRITYYINNNNPITYYHQKSFYVRMGRPDWKVKLQGGFSHQVYWGNEKAAYGENYKLSSFNSFFYVLTGRAYGATGIPRSKIGNQVGSIDLAAEYNSDNYRFLLYRQNFYDVGALSKLANIRDGLNGLSIENKYFEGDDDHFNWKKILVEFFYSKDQAGYPTSIPTASGDEDYYNNYYYQQGWSYKGTGIGNPLITRAVDANPGQVSKQPQDYFINNRVIAFHVGMTGDYRSWNFTTKLSFSKNFGTFGTSEYGNSTGGIFYTNLGPRFDRVNQFSFYLTSRKQLQNGFNIGYETAFDVGKLLKNSAGLSLILSKSF